MNLHPLPAGFAETRDSLHQIAFFVLGAARYRATGRMGLQAAPGGFGTREFDGRLARVEGASLVYEQADRIATQTITTVRAAADFVGIEYLVDWFDGEFHDPLRPVDPDSPLAVDDTAARALGHWFDFGYDLLEELRSHAGDDDDASAVQLWPEHFDPAMEMGDETMGRRASYGASPGDAAHDEPYLYVSAWGEIDGAYPYWNDGAFSGSSLGYSDLVAAADPKSKALEFLLEGHRILHAS